MQYDIKTRKLPATDTQGMRVRAATAATGGTSITIPWDYALSGEAMHAAAAQRLLDVNLPGFTVTLAGHWTRGYYYQAERTK